MMPHVMIAACAALLALAGPAEAKKGRLSFSGSKPAASPSPQTKTERPASQGRVGVIVVPAIGGAGAGATAAASAHPAQALGAASERQAFSSLQPAAQATPAANPDARRLPQIGGDPGDLRPAKGFQTIN